MTRISTFACAAAFLLAPSPSSHGQCERQKFLPAAATGLETFGNSLDRDGDAIIVGAQGEDSGSGAAYVWRHDGTQWIEEQRLFPAGSNNDNFGRSVAIDGDVVVIGEPATNFNHGTIHVFERIAGLWTEVALLDDPSADFLGEAVAIEDDVILVGAFHDELVLGFLRPSTGWANATFASFVLTASDAGGTFNFGRSVAIQGDTIVVGASGWDDSGGLINDGRVYVFEEPAGGWVTSTETAKLTPATDQGSNCGWSVAIDGDWIVAGAPTLDVDPGAPQVRSGVAYLFQKPAGSWVDASETQRVEPSDAGDLDRFGEDVAIEDDDVVCGASGENACYQYRFDGVSFADELKIEPADPFQVSQFGWCVDLEGEVLLTGAPTTDTTAGANSGAVFDIVPDPISATFATYGAGGLTLSGAVVGPCDNELQIDVTGARPSMPFVFLMLGTGQGTGVTAGGYQFWVDLGQPFMIVALAPFDAAGNLSLAAALALDTPVGAIGYLQIFASDPAGKLWSNGLELTVVE